MFLILILTGMGCLLAGAALGPTWAFAGMSLIFIATMRQARRDEEGPSR
jgi:hypothetical protein